MTDVQWFALACGLIGGLGLWSVTSRLPAFGRPRLAGRIAPFLTDVSEEARRMQQPSGVDPAPVLGVLAVPAVDAFQKVFGSLLGGTNRTTVLLARAGRDRTVAQHRLRQLLWAVGGAALGAAIGATTALHGSVAGLVAAPIVGVVAGPLVCDRLLAAEGDRRVRRIESELPTVLEFLALGVAAGEGVRDAIRRVARVGSGVLPALLATVVDETAVGVPLSAALTRTADELRIPSLTRCFGHITGALERGSPLAEVLRVQAADARDASRRALLEAAGKKEIGMLVPLVFLILPVTVAFAVFPGILVLQTQL